MPTQDNAEKAIAVVEALAGTTMPTPTAVAVVTTTPTTSAYGFTSAQAVALLASINALVVDVAALAAVLQALVTASA